MNRFLKVKPTLKSAKPSAPATSYSFSPTSAVPTPVIKLVPNSELAKAFQAAHAKLNPETPDAA